eukprot:Skav224007  [mRNA]  locus=scaffold2932:40630:46101:+ [translate_table: standard]
MHHVEAHCGNPYNEAADSLAWAAVHRWIRTWTLEDTLSPLTLDGRYPDLLQWAWYLSYVEQTDPLSLDLNSQTIRFDLQAPFATAPASIEALQNTDHETVPGPPALMPLHFSCATANVLTLFPGASNAAGFISARQESLMRLFRQHAVLVCGIQETRSKSEGHLDTEHFHVLSSPSTAAGQYGTQLWVAKSWPFQNDAIAVKHTHLRILHSTSRRLVVLLQHPLIRLIFVVGHTPSGEDATTLRKWWNATSNAIPNKWKHVPIIGFFDANARLGSQQSESVDTCGAEEENVSGMCFHEWMQQEGLIAPQTHTRWHQGPHTTWCHSSGQESRLDYVVFSHELIDACRSVHRSEVDLSLQHRDHFSVQCNLIFQVDMHQHRGPLPAVETAPPSQDEVVCIPWSMNVHSHADQLHGWLRRFQPPKKAALRRKPHLTESTWNLILQKKFHWQRYDLLHWLRTFAAVGPGIVKRAAVRHIFQEHIAYHLQVASHKLLQTFPACGYELLDTAPMPRTSQDDRPGFVCEQCDQTFDSQQAWQAHQWRKHNYPSIERRYVHSDTCVACRRCFWTAQRLQIHLRQSRDAQDGCLQYLMDHVAPLDEVVTFPMNEQVAGFRQVPTVLTAGPEVPPLPAKLFPPATHDPTWRSQWLSRGLPASLLWTQIDMLHAQLDECTHLWRSTLTPSDDDLIHTWLQCLETFPDANEGASWWAFAVWGFRRCFQADSPFESHQEMICAAFEELCATQPVWALLTEGARIPGAIPLDGLLRSTVTIPKPRLAPMMREQIAFTYGCWDGLLAKTDLQRLPVVDKDRPVPVLQLQDGSLALVCVHLFSGRRRQFDIHWWLEHFAPAILHDMKIMVVSVDTAVHAEAGNLLHGRGIQAVLDLAYHKGIGLCLCGPPCETWSAARHVQVEGASRAPRPLRSRTQPWGVDGLNMRELAQLHTGNQLMLQGLVVARVTTLQGGGEVMEHPDIPQRDECASIWLTPQNEVMMDGEDATLSHIQQCDYGAVAVKATGLRSVGIPAFTEGMRVHRDPHRQRAVTQLIGLNPTTHEFNTAIAKEYPWQMSRAIALTSLEGLQARVLRNGVTVAAFAQFSKSTTDWLFEMVQHSSTSHGTTWFPDYQPQR